MSEDDWKKISSDVRFNYNHDSYFSELKEVEIMKERLDIMSQMDEYVGRYYSTEWVRKNILRQSDEEMRTIDTQIQKESPPDGEGEEEEETQ